MLIKRITKAAVILSFSFLLINVSKTIAEQADEQNKITVVEKANEATAPKPMSPEEKDKDQREYEKIKVENSKSPDKKLKHSTKTIKHEQDKEGKTARLSVSFSPDVDIDSVISKAKDQGIKIVNWEMLIEDEVGNNHYVGMKSANYLTNEQNRIQFESMVEQIKQKDFNGNFKSKNISSLDFIGLAENVESFKKGINVQ